VVAARSGGQCTVMSGDPLRLSSGVRGRHRPSRGQHRLELTRQSGPRHDIAPTGRGRVPRRLELVFRSVVSVDAPGTERDLSYAWDLAGRRSAVTHPDGAVVRSTYDPLGRLATVAHPTLGTTTYAWDSDGRLRSEDLPGVSVLI